MDFSEQRRRFFTNPNQNPITGKRLIKGKGPYEKFVTLFGEPPRFRPSINPNDIQPEIHSDILYNVMMHSDIDTLSDTCRGNKITQKICSDKSFWLEKFDRDGLPFFSDVIPKTTGKWIYEYRRTERVINDLPDVLKFLTNQHGDTFQGATIRGTINSPVLNFPWLPEHLKNQVNFPTQSFDSVIVMFYIQIPYIWITYKYNNIYVNTSELIVTNNEMQNALELFMYTYPDITLTLRDVPVTLRDLQVYIPRKRGQIKEVQRRIEFLTQS